MSQKRESIKSVVPLEREIEECPECVITEETAKLKGLSELFFCRVADENVELSTNGACGISLILEESVARLKALQTRI